jgi:hypothetical protein
MPPANSNLAIALLHYPVYNKLREVVTTAITNLDVHDIARSSKTFGLDRFYIVTPSKDQQALAHRITGHWQDGWGATYNPDRKEALDIVYVLDSLKQAQDDYQAGFAQKVQTVITGAAPRGGSITCQAFRQMLDNPDTPFLLLLGTGWGLTDEYFNAADHVLEPIAGAGTYNHLSVRSAAAIMLDRLRGK